LLFDVGFQLSYAAVFAIVWFFPLLNKFWMPRNWLLKKGWEIIAVSLAAQLGVLPITLFYFHHFPGLFVLTSLLILPAMTFILGMGILVISLALINALPPFLVVAYNTVIQWMNSIIAWVGQQEQFLFRNISFDTVHFILAYGIIFSWASLMDKATYRKAVCLMGCILGLQIWSQGRLFHIAGKESAFIGHVGRHSALVHQLGHRIMVYNSNPLAAERMATDYAIALNARELINKPLKNSYRLGGQRIIVLDSTLVTLPAISGDFTLWLTQSPKVNLDRILDSVRPKVVVADGNNFRSYIGRWEATCMKKKIPFHYTGDKGAFMFGFH
jgi:competence protein ComEC